MLGLLLLCKLRLIVIFSARLLTQGSVFNKYEKYPSQNETVSTSLSKLVYYFVFNLNTDKTRKVFRKDYFNIIIRRNDFRCYKTALYLTNKFEQVLYKKPQHIFKYSSNHGKHTYIRASCKLFQYNLSNLYFEKVTSC